MSVPRPPRRTVGALDARRRQAILDEGANLVVNRSGVRLTADRVFSEYRRQEFFGDLEGVLFETAERYGLPSNSLMMEVARRAGELVDAGLYADDLMTLDVSYSAREDRLERAVNEHGRRLTLLVLPEPEFLTALEHAAAWARSVSRVTGERSARALLTYADRVCAAHAVPYQLDENGQRFRWVGDRAAHDLAIVPALRALDHPALVGAREEFSQALVKRRAGRADDLRDAAHEAGNAVEAVLLALIDAHGRDRPKARTASALFNRLAEPASDGSPGVLPGALQHLTLAAPEIRNSGGGHTQGPVPPTPAPHIADAAIAAAAAAIPTLVHYLPS